ncbi:uracil-DNA glycosylase [Halobacterium noricense]|uniref:uracil-DNA glycosylase n=1 Tax=Halobacterium noricense TaxID=223182 RepID=UPI001E2F91B4|nr:uracil-DNA glycosylase family protein [Halobacterium noricense]UHH25123.1 uracil-DNA glycosylase [Halobacterium noricense]
MAEFPDPDTRHVLDAGCERCPALVESRNCISWGQGSLDADLVVVGEAPGAGGPDAEQWRGGNYTGLAYTTRHSGRRVRDLAADLGHPDAYFTNAVKCHPPENRDPMPDERETCAGHLETELAEIEPTAVLATGKHATASLLSLADHALDGFVSTVGDCVHEGRPLDWPGFDAALVPALHPSYEDVWLSRLDLSRAEYVAGLRDALAAARRQD